jgi:ketol-acid reductoisomerase
MTPQKAILEIKQSRSKYQLEKFAIGQHHSPEMQYYQLLLEMETLYEALEENGLRVEKLLAEAEELRETGKKSDAIEAIMKERAAERIEQSAIGAKRELAFMEELFEKYPKFTREQIEAAQPDYWRERLIRTAQFQALSGSVTWAQVEAIWQAGVLPELLDSSPIQALENLKSPALPSPRED